MCPAYLIKLNWIELNLIHLRDAAYKSIQNELNNLIWHLTEIYIKQK